MSGAIGQSWYSHNATRNFPLVDGPGVFATDGREFPTDILVDARIRGDLSLGEWVELSGITIGPALVTAVFSINGDAGRRAGGAVSVVGTMVPGRPYPVTPVLNGRMTGWVTFGPGALTAGSWRLADEGCRLAPRAGQRFSQGRVTTITRLQSADLLKGVVRLLGGQDVEVVKETIRIDGVQRDAIVLRLVAELDSTEVFQRYLGECSGRPESGTCAVPPIERIGPAVPDCDGNIEISFDPPLSGVAGSAGGLAVGHLFGLTETCGDDGLGSEGIPGDVDLGCSSIGQDDAGDGTGAGTGNAVIVVNIPAGYEIGRVVMLDTGESYVLTFGTYSAIFRDVPAGTRTVTISTNLGETISWSAFYAEQSGSGEIATFDLSPTRTFEQVTFSITG